MHPHYNSQWGQITNQIYTTDVTMLLCLNIKRIEYLENNLNNREMKGHLLWLYNKQYLNAKGMLCGCSIIQEVMRTNVLNVFNKPPRILDIN
jgi:hypothetical protein